MDELKSETNTIKNQLETCESNKKLLVVKFEAERADYEQSLAKSEEGESFGTQDWLMFCK